VQGSHLEAVPSSTISGKQNATRRNLARAKNLNPCIDAGETSKQHQVSTDVRKKKYTVTELEAGDKEERSEVERRTAISCACRSSQILLAALCGFHAPYIATPKHPRNLIKRVTCVMVHGKVRKARRGSGRL
jgi:hypothetical protein